MLIHLHGNHSSRRGRARSFLVRVARAPVIVGALFALAVTFASASPAHAQIRMAAIGGNSGNQCANEIFSSGDLTGSIDRITDATYNALAADPDALRAAYDVLLFTWASPTTVNADWATRVRPYLERGGGVVFEDDQNVGDLAPAVVGASAGGGSSTVTTTVPGLTDGILDSFANNHITFSSWDTTFLDSFLVLTGTTTVTGLYGELGCGRIVLTGPDQDFHGSRGAAGAAGNQYNLLLNSVRWVTAIGGGCSIGGTCVAAGTVDPANECQVCDPARSTTSYSPGASGTSCDDGMFCTVSDACDGAGSCTGTARDCSDTLSCTTDACDDIVDACTNTLAGGCIIGSACVPSGAADPGNECMVCDPASSTTSYSPAPSTTSCDDGMFCTVSDTCDGAGSCGGAARDCSDALSCTTDACDETADTCTSTLATGCLIGGACVPDGAADPGNECMVCDPTASTASYSPASSGTTCDDGMFCTVTDACDGAGSCAGAARDCSDALSCTTDACDETADTCTSTLATGCLIAGACVADGTADPANECMVCEPSTTTASYSPAASGTTCDDGMFCTVTDACDGAGSCAGSARDCSDGLDCTADACDEAASSCTNDLTTGCLIAGACVAESTIDPTDVCRACDPAMATDVYSLRPVDSRCGEPSCEGSTITPAPACDASGACVTPDAMECPDGALCADDMMCSSGCTDDDECIAPFYCAVDVCVPDEDLGIPCDRDGMCLSGMCVDGVCCDAGCDGECEACDVAGSEGTCSPHAAGTDPEDECPEGELCNGERVCEAPEAPDAGPPVVPDAGVPDAGETEVIVRGSGCACRAVAPTGAPSPLGLGLGLGLMLGALALRRRRR